TARADRALYVLSSASELSGADLAKAKVEYGSATSTDPRVANKPYISIEMKRDGARKFEKVTSDNVGKRLAIVLDDVVYSAPNIQERIAGGRAQITGKFTSQEANDLSIVLNTGNLIAPIKPISTSIIGATLGSDSIRSGKLAGIIGLLAVVIFMLFYYKLCGFIADIALVFNVGFILAMLTAFGASLTMPGIAGIILTIGMAVDANVLIYERIREELDNGKTPRSAVDAGYKRAVITVWDSNLTTLIAAVVLYNFGTGPIRGFAVTLSIGIIGSMFTAIVLVRSILDTFVLKGTKDHLSI
ncbi:MAG: protein translocase subunit SecD, partial [Candidatus Cloacimonetes bacterium]|nr:protein translocase subunit SecD [Candidatus Cloacimonadota bacterium]